MIKCLLLTLPTLILSAQGAAPAPQAPPAPKEAAASAPVQPAPPAAPEAPKPLDENAVIGRIGQRVIHERDLHAWMKAQVPNQKQLEGYLKNVSMMANVRKQYLESLVLATKARMSGLNALPEYESQMAFQADRILQGLLMNPEREGSKGAEIKKAAENPSEEEIEGYFIKNAQRYDTPEKFSARHILVGTKGSPRMGDKGLTEEEAKAQIAKIQAELGQGKKFEDAAKEYSDDPGSKSQGGLIKNASFGGFAKEFEEAVRKQEIGKVGEPVKTQFGYHLIVVEELTPKQPATLDKVRDRVKMQLASEIRETRTKAFIEEAKKDVDFVEGPEAAKGLKPVTPVKPKGKAKVTKK